MSSTPVAVNNATADVGIFLMIGALRQAYVPLTSIREGQWLGKSTLGRDPKGKVLGILGMGGIGRVNYTYIPSWPVSSLTDPTRKWQTAPKPLE